IAIGEQTVQSIIGSYSWSYYDIEKGETVATEQDTAPPPELVKEMVTTTVHNDAEVELLFDYPPDDYKVSIWSEEQIIDSFEEMKLNPYLGEVVYEVEANWEQGTVSYAFILYIE